MPMGPFYLADLLGLDTVLHVAEHLHESTASVPRAKPMQELVEAGNLGQKTGKGFYEHGSGRAVRSARSSTAWASRPSSSPAWCSRRAWPPRRTSRSE